MAKLYKHITGYMSEETKETENDKIVNKFLNSNNYMGYDYDYSYLNSAPSYTTYDCFCDSCKLTHSITRIKKPAYSLCPTCNVAVMNDDIKEKK